MGARGISRGEDEQNEGEKLQMQADSEAQLAKFKAELEADQQAAMEALRKQNDEVREQKQAELEEAFPFIETPDQLTTIEDVKKDMEAAVPMDRLVSGDVGFGIFGRFCDSLVRRLGGDFVFFAERLEVVPRPPVPEPLRAQPFFQAVEVRPLTSGTARRINARQLPVDIHQHTPRVRVFGLIAETAARLLAPDPINHRVFAQPADGTQVRQVGLGDGHGDPQRQVLLGCVLWDRVSDILRHGDGDTLYHVVDKQAQITYIMIHAVGRFR